SHSIALRGCIENVKVATRTNAVLRFCIREPFRENTMSSSLSKIPPGVQYIFDAEVRVRRWIEREIMSVLAGWSYAEIILPIFDYADLFALGMGKEQAEMTYR